MTDKPTWKVAHLDDIERRGRDIPLREHLGTHAFGVNAFTPGEDGTLINEHDEAGSGQEELYIVLDGNATFEIDGETVDAVAGDARVRRACVRGGRPPGTEPSLLSAPPLARHTRGSTGVRHGRFTVSR